MDNTHTYRDKQKLHIPHAERKSYLRSLEKTRKNEKEKHVDTEAS